MAKNKQRLPRLGRGLSTLMTQPVDIRPDSNQAKSAQKPAAITQTKMQPDDLTAQSTLDVTFLEITAIHPNPHQPRQKFDPTALEKLAESIRLAGLMQPVVVRPATDTTEGEYQLIVGERRLRAAKMAGLLQLPAIIRDIDDHEVAEWALIENLQREDLNPMERARAFSKLADDFGLSHQQMADRLGVDRSTISNTLRLLNLQPDVQAFLLENVLSAGQAKALVAIDDPQLQIALAKKTIQQDWSVRKLERAAADAKSNGEQIAGNSESTASPPASSRSIHLADLEEQLSQQLETRVRIRPGRKKATGTLWIEFYSIEQFDALLERMGVEAR